MTVQARELFIELRLLQTCSPDGIGNFIVYISCLFTAIHCPTVDYWSSHTHTLNVGPMFIAGGMVYL